jgi:hypothetical protein
VRVCYKSVMCVSVVCVRARVCVYVSVRLCVPVYVFVIYVYRSSLFVNGEHSTVDS